MKALRYLCVVLLCGLALPVGAGTALCIGINEAESFKPLKHAEQDAAKLAETLRQNGHEVTLLTGRDAVRERVVAALAEHPDIVYFAGHARKDFLMLADGPLCVRELAGQTPLMLLDCCYVGSVLQATGTTRVYAAAEYEAFERGGHGLFTKYLLKWLADGRSIEDGNLLDFVGRGIRRETGGWQKPRLGFI